MELDSSSKNAMTRFNINNQLWQQPQGFLWYNEKQAYKIAALKSSQGHEIQKQSLEPHDQRIEALKKEFNRAKRKALDNPTLANVIVAQRLQKQIMEKAQEFAAMWQLAAILDYRLTSINEPTNSLHKRLYEEKLAQENDYKLKKLAKDWGLILQIDNLCSYCYAFAPIVKQFADKYGFQLIFGDCVLKDS